MKQYSYEEVDAIRQRIERNQYVVLYVRITTIIIIVSLVIVKYLIL